MRSRCRCRCATPTRHHCDRVGLLAQCLAHCDLGQEACAQVGLAARFHDIGKIGIPDEVLLAPRRHTDEERAIMREHPVRGEHIFLATGRSDAAPVAQLIRAHHEAFDGSGYPDGLRGETIPLGARIVTIVDAYDAMTSVPVSRRNGARNRLADHRSAVRRAGGLRAAALPSHAGAGTCAGVAARRRA